MKKILCFLLILFSLKSFAQYPNGIQAIGNDSNVVDIKGALRARVINKVFADTSTANLSHMDEYPGAQIFTTSDNQFWLRNSSATQWIPAGGAGISIINIITDSSISICNFNSCDTFITNVTAQLVTILDDSTLLVCDTLNVCDTLHIPRTQFAQTLFDTTNIYNQIQNVYNYFSDTSFTNQFFPRGDGVLLDTVIRITDSTLRFIYTDGTQKEDTFRIALTQENITNITNIINYIDSLRGNDTTFILSASNLQSGLKALYSTTDSLSGNDTLHLEFPHNNIAEDSVLTTDVDGDLKMKLVTSGSGGVTNTGNGYRLVTGDGALIKSVNRDLTLTIDSLTSGELTFKVDTSQIATTYDNSLKQNLITLTTTGTSGASTFNQGTGALNIPQYTTDISGKLNISDTASMLDPYKNKVDTIYRTPGKDSIQYKISGRYHAIRDSIGSSGGGAADSSLFWSLTGNVPNRVTNYMGSKTNVSVPFRTNNLERMVLDSNGRLGLGIGLPLTQLNIQTAATNSTYVNALRISNPGSGSNTGASINLSYDNLGTHGATLKGGFGSTDEFKIALGSTEYFTHTTAGLVLGTSGVAHFLELRSNAFGSQNGLKFNDASGVLNFFPAYASSFAFQGSSGAPAIILSSSSSKPSVLFQNWAASSAASQLTTAIRALSAQTGDLTQWQKSDSTVYSRMSSDGRLAIGDTANINSIVTLKSTTSALLFPRMTTTQKNNLASGIIAGTIAGGSGYTDGVFSSTSLTGGTGTGGVAQISVVGGVVTAVVITTRGTGYVVGDVLSASLAGGTGFTYTLTEITGKEGMVVYDLTLHKLCVYTGTAWETITSL